MKEPTHKVITSPELRRLLLDHQYLCSADCCKGRAFQISEGSIERWLDGERIDRTQQIAAEIASIGADLLGVAGRVFLAARGLESEWDPSEFRAFWGRFRVAYASAAEARQRIET